MKTMYTIRQNISRMICSGLFVGLSAVAVQKVRFRMNVR